MNDEPVLRLEEVTRRFGSGDTALDILRGVELSLRPGELVALVGPSGAGKSTLLHIAGPLENPTSGRVLIGGQACASLGDLGRTRMRRGAIAIGRAHGRTPRIHE